MRLDYLKWYKALEAKLINKDQTHILISSAIYEPTELLQSYLREFVSSEFDRRILRFSGYGHEGLKESIAERFRTSPDKIAITRGASNAIFLACRAFLNPGDNVIIESPAYEPLLASPDYMNIEITQLLRKPPHFGVDIDELINLIKDNTKLIMLTNLHNPSGAYLTQTMISNISEAVAEKNPEIKIIVDEIYKDFNPDDTYTAANIDNNMISFNSLTKVYGLGIVHCGWLIADTNTIRKINDLQTLTEGSGSRFLEAFASFIVDHLDDYLERSLAIVSENRTIMAKYADVLLDKEIITGQVPQYGCIYFPRFNDIESTDELVDKLSSDYNIYTVPGRFFGHEKHMRLGYSTPSAALEKALCAFVEAVEKILS